MNRKAIFSVQFKYKKFCIILRPTPHRPLWFGPIFRFVGTYFNMKAREPSAFNIKRYYAQVARLNSYARERCNEKNSLFVIVVGENSSIYWITWSARMAYLTRRIFVINLISSFADLKSLILPPDNVCLQCNRWLWGKSVNNRKFTKR